MAKRPKLSEDPDYFSKTVDLIKGESDRGAALVAACLIEEELQDILDAQAGWFKLSNKDRDDLFSFSKGPLGSLSAKIKVARLFGIVSKGTAADADLVREIRNQAAHIGTEFSFQDPLVRQKMTNFQMCKVLKSASLEGKALFAAIVARVCLSIYREMCDYINQRRIVLKASLDALKAELILIEGHEAHEEADSESPDTSPNQGG